MAMPTIINSNSLIPIGLVVTLMGVCVSVGVVYNKVEETRGDVSELKAQVTRLDDKLDALMSRSSVASQ